MLLRPGQAAGRCKICQDYRKSLHTMLRRLKATTGNSAHVSSHTNYRYLTSVARSTRMHNLHKSYTLARRRIKRMQTRVTELLKRDGVRVSKATDSDLRHIMKASFSQIAKEYPENTFQRVFWNQHSQNALCKNARGVRWHPAMIRWCLYLRHISGRAYETLRNTGMTVTDRKGH